MMSTRNKGRKKSWDTRDLIHLRHVLENYYEGEIPLSNLSKLTGRTVQDLSNKFRADDMKLSCAEEIAHAIGYELKLLFPQKTYLPGITTPKPKYNFKEKNQLTGLVQYFNDSNLTVHCISQRTGLNTNGLMKAIRKGDIHIKDLNRILRELNIDIIWEFRKIS